MLCNLSLIMPQADSSYRILSEKLKVMGMVNYAMIEDNVFMRSVGAAMQIGQMSRGEEPFDLSNPDNVQTVVADIVQRGIKRYTV
jgi:hypothetical protein